MLEEPDLPWMVGVIAGDVFAHGFAQAVIRRGGHLRVGLEDFHGDDDAAHEDLVVAKAVSMPRARPRGGHERADKAVAGPELTSATVTSGRGRSTVT